MNRLIDKTLNSLFKLAERLTGGGVPSNHQTPQPPVSPKIRFTKADKWVQGKLFD